MAIDANLDARLCCGDWLSTPIGSLREASPREVWHSDTAQRIRASILDGSFGFCSQEACPHLRKGTLPFLDEVKGHAFLNHPEPGGPRILSLGYDNSCNLKCPSCRPHFINLRGEALDRAEALQEELISERFLGAEVLIITGTGDAFASSLYRRLLRSFDPALFPGVSIEILTNGLLFTREMWASMQRAQAAITGVSVSVDAVTTDTYAVNRGGSFAKLRRNLEFLSELLREGALAWFEISFVVQQNNYREMPAFAHWGEALGCTSVLFQQVMHWEDAQSLASYSAMAVHEPGHPEHAEFLRVLRHPSLANPKVDLSNLAPLREDRRGLASAHPLRLLNPKLGHV
jgi:pyruvate-formate lyase-activating enzyme